MPQSGLWRKRNSRKRRRPRGKLGIAAGVLPLGRECLPCRRPTRAAEAEGGLVSGEIGPFPMVSCAGP